MGITSQEVWDALILFGPIEWIRVSTGKHPLEERYQVPHVAWRFRNRSQDLASDIEAMVAGSPTREGWTLDHSRGNWLLAPTRLLEESSTKQLAFRDAGIEISLSDQEFCRIAQLDLELIMDTMKKGA